MLLVNNLMLQSIQFKLKDNRGKGETWGDWASRQAAQSAATIS